MLCLTHIRSRKTQPEALLLHYMPVTGLTTCTYVCAPCFALEFANNTTQSNYVAHSCPVCILSCSVLMYVKAFWTGALATPICHTVPHPWFHHQLEHSSWVQLVGLADKRSPIPEDTKNYGRLYICKVYTHKVYAGLCSCLTPIMARMSLKHIKSSIGRQNFAWTHLTGKRRFGGDSHKMTQIHF